MLNRAFVHRRRWQRAFFSFVLSVAFFVAGNAFFARQAYAQFRDGSASTAMPPIVPEIPNQHQQPVQPSTPVIPAKVEPSTPLVAPIAPKVDPNAPKVSQTERNQIIERHAEQLKSGDCSRKLEQRRRALRQGRAGSRNQR